MKKETLLKGYLTYMDYAATGEGRTMEMNFCYAKNKTEALEKHLDRFVGNDVNARKYFGVGICVNPIKSDESKYLIKSVFNFGNGLYKDLVNAGIEFHLKIHFNYN